MNYFRVVALLAGLLAFRGLAYAGTCDLTSTSFGNYCGDSSAPAGLNGALFQEVNPQATGTGFIDPFVRVHPGGSATVEGAYNTTGNKVLDNDAPDNWNQAVLLSNLIPVVIGGTSYYQFNVDINEAHGPGNEDLLSLDDVQIFLSGTPNQTVTSFAGGDPTVVDLAGTLVYHLDSNTDNIVLMNQGLNPGSGSGDMNMYIPTSLFDPNDGQYMYLYTHFGNTTQGQTTFDSGFAASDGFEEWRVLTGVPSGNVPEPATLVLLGTGLLGVAGKLRRRMKKS
jgi:hypothetical protein